MGRARRQSPGGERHTDRRAATVWILELPGGSGTIHLMHHCPGFACSCHDVKTSGAVHKSFIVKLSTNWLTSNCCAVQHDSEYGGFYREPAVFDSAVIVRMPGHGASRCPRRPPALLNSASEQAFQALQDALDGHGAKALATEPGAPKVGFLDRAYEQRWLA